MYIRSPRLVLLRVLNSLSLRYSSNYLRGDDFRQLGNGKISRETISDSLEMAKSPERRFPTAWKWQNLQRDAELNVVNLRNALNRLSLRHSFLSLPLKIVLYRWKMRLRQSKTKPYCGNWMKQFKDYTGSKPLGREGDSILNYKSSNRFQNLCCLKFCM